jgi:hypothetical protein
MVANRAVIAERRADPAEPRAQLGRLGLQPLGAGHGPVQLGEPGGGGAGEVERGGLVAAVLAGQLPQERDALVHLVQAPRVDQHVLGVAAQAGGQVGELGGEPGGALGQLAEGGVVAALAAEPAGGRAERGDRAAVVVALQRLPGRQGRGAQRLGVGQPLGLGGQVGQLTDADLGGVDLLELVAQQLGLAFAVPGAGLQVVQLADDCAQAPPGRGELGAQCQGRLAGEAVEQVQLHPGAEQLLELVLAVDLDQRADHVGDGLHGGHAPLELRAAAPLDQHLAGDDHLAVLGFDAGGGQRLGGLLAVGGVQPAFDQRAGTAGPDRAQVGALPQQQPERVDHHGLARAGLAGEHVQAGGDLEPGVVDDAKVTDAQLAQHHRRFYPSP